MPIKSMVQGNCFEICCWKESDEECPVEAFFLELKNSGYPDLLQMMRLIKRAAELGPPHNEEFSRKLEGKAAEDLFEFKADAIRVLWFYDGRKIICSHGFLKKAKKTPKGEIERAQETRRKYADEQQRERDREKPSLRNPIHRTGRKR